MTEKEVLGLIFKPGFTTAETADDLKGRGVGLDEVMSTIKELKGSIEVESSAGKGTTITLYLPLTLAINTVIIGDVAGETLAVPMSAVERAVKVDETEIEHMGETEVFTLLAQTVPLVRVDELLSMPRPASERPDGCYVVVLNVGDKRFGIAFDTMSGKQDVVVKSLGTLIVEAPFTAGATLLGERCILILDPMDIAANLGKPRSASARRDRAAAERIRPRLLLVEDEALTRVKLKRIFEEAGIEVFEAVDGKEALDAARDMAFQIVSTDVIMPRMDGYELTRKLREMPRYRDVPIIMISSRVDRNAGFEAGVDHYLVKPVDRNELLGLVQRIRL
jgi:two-component system chemotaxis sensor kinase CheA